MRLSEVTLRVRDFLEDHSSTTQHWTDCDIARYVNQGVMYMFRWQCDRHLSYHNYELDLTSADATQLHSNVYVYRLPRWVHRISRIRETKGSTESTGSDIMPSAMMSNACGWYFDTAKTLRMTGFTDAKSLTVSVAKSPARLHQGTTPADGSTTLLYTMDHPTPSSSTYDLEDEPDSYVNSIFELTGVADAGRDPVGQVRTCTSSARAHRAGGEYYTALTLGPVFTEAPDEDDTYEMHPEIDDAHMRFLILLAGRYAFMSHHNIGALEASKIDFAEERKRFIDACAPRNDGRPKFWSSASDWEIGQDPDRDNLLGRYMGFN